MAEPHPFKWRHFQAEIILRCVRYSLSYRDLQEMMLERGLHVDHSTISRWVQRYAPEREKRCRPHLKACNDSWRVAETSIKIKKGWFSLYRAVDSDGNTLEFLLSPTRDAEAAKCFFLKALRPSARSASEVCPRGKAETASFLSGASQSAPRVITVAKNAASPKAIADLKATGVLPHHLQLRQVKDLNHLIEQDHRAHQEIDEAGDGLLF